MTPVGSSEKSSSSIIGCDNLKMLTSMASRVLVTFVTCFFFVARKMNCVSDVSLALVACSMENSSPKMVSACHKRERKSA